MRRSFTIVALALTLAGCAASQPSRGSDVISARSPQGVAAVLAMPSIQPGWIVAGVDGDITSAGRATITSGRNHYPEWDYEASRTWMVRLADGTVFAIEQAGPPMAPGQKVSLVRYGARLAIAP